MIAPPRADDLFWGGWRLGNTKFRLRAPRRTRRSGGIAVARPGSTSGVSLMGKLVDTWRRSLTTSVPTPRMIAVEVAERTGVEHHAESPAQIGLEALSAGHLELLARHHGRQACDICAFFTYCLFRGRLKTPPRQRGPTLQRNCGQAK